MMMSTSHILAVGLSMKLKILKRKFLKIQILIKGNRRRIQIKNLRESKVNCEVAQERIFAEYFRKVS